MTQDRVLLLVVKGKPQLASEVAHKKLQRRPQDKNVSIVGVKLGESQTSIEVRDVSTQEHERVVRWFNEPDTPEAHISGYGLRDGTLLFYNYQRPERLADLDQSALPIAPGEADMHAEAQHHAADQ